jgi:PAS domain-containing protein
LVFPDGSSGAAVIAHDITSQVTLEQALQDSEERFSLLTESISEGIAILREKSVVTANSRLLSILGCKRIECLSEKIDAVVPGWPSTVPLKANTYTTQLRRGGTVPKRAEVSVNPVKYDGHQAVMVLVRETAN